MSLADKLCRENVKTNNIVGTQRASDDLIAVINL